MLSKTDYISIYVFDNKIYPNTIINIGFKLKCNWFVLQKLKRAHPCNCSELAYASEPTCLAYTIFLTIKEKLAGSALELSKSNLLNVDCNYHNGQFIISIHLPNSMSNMKKNINQIIPKINPSRNYSLFSECMRILNGKPNKKEFNYCVDLLQGIRIDMVILGNLKINKESLDGIAKTASSNLTLKNNSKPKDIPFSLKKQQGVSDFPTIKTTSYKSVFIQDFIENETKLPVAVYSTNVTIYHKKWKTISSKIKPERIASFVDKKYKKLGDMFIPMVLYDIMSKVLLDTTCLIKLYKDSPSPSTVKNHIMSAFGI